MGYYTGYALDIKGPEDIVEKAIATINANEEMTYALGNDLDGGNDCKWYDHEEDMVKLSEQYPDLLFTLSGSGEEHHDQWNKYFFGGLIQEEMIRVIQPGPFDPSRLKTLKQLNKERQ